MLFGQRFSPGQTVASLSVYHLPPSTRCLDDAHCSQRVIFSKIFLIRSRLRRPSKPQPLDFVQEAQNERHPLVLGNFQVIAQLNTPQDQVIGRSVMFFTSDIISFRILLQRAIASCIARLVPQGGYTEDLIMMRTNTAPIGKHNDCPRFKAESHSFCALNIRQGGFNIGEFCYYLAPLSHLAWIHPIIDLQSCHCLVQYTVLG